MTIHKWNAVPILIAVGLIIACAISLSLQGTWDQSVTEFILVFVGGVAFLFSETFASFSGGYGWTRSQWLQHPDWYVKIVGSVLLLYNANAILDLV